MGPNIREQTSNWMTPTAQDSEAAGGAGTIARGMRGATLNSQVMGLWPTPDVCSGSRDMSKVDPDAQRRPDTKVTIGLPTVASTWPTPASRDYRSPNAESYEERGGGREGRTTEQLRGAPLLFAPGPADPRWPAILDDHPELAPALEPAFRSVVDGLAFDMGDSRAARLKCVGNGVVALQAAAAFVVLVRRARVQIA